MTIEKAFAIKAPAHEIYAELVSDVNSAAEDGSRSFEVVRRDPGRSLDLRVTIAGVPCWLSYRLEPKEDHTEVVATLTPFGFKYLFYQLITLGLRNEGFAVVLVQGLANLKEAVESRRLQTAGDADPAG